MRKTRTGVVSCIGGCYVCHGSDAGWQGRNTLAVAARHHDATGHPTWVEQVMVVKYGAPIDSGQLEMFSTEGATNV